MATPLWAGNSLADKQIDEFDFGGVWIATETITITINGKGKVVEAGSTVIATIIETVQAALAAETDEDFDAIDWTEDDSSKVIATAATAGIPIDVIFTTDSVAGTINKSNAQAVKGPNFWDNADAWEGDVPVASDTPKIANSDVPILFGLDQSGITLDRLDVPASFTGGIGQMRYGQAPSIGTFKGTSDRYLNIGVTDLFIGFGEGAGSKLLYFDFGAVQTNVVVDRTAIPSSGEDYAVKLLGSHASNVVTVNRGRVGIADEPGQTATLSTLRVNQKTNPADSLVFCGAGVTLTTLEASGGTTILECDATTVNVYGGTVELAEGDYTNVNVYGGTLIWKSAGTITTLKIFDEGAVDGTKDLRSRTVTNPIQMSKGATLDDRFGTINTPYDVDPQNCDLADVIYYTGPNLNATIDT